MHNIFKTTDIYVPLQTMVCMNINTFSFLFPFLLFFPLFFVFFFSCFFSGLLLAFSFPVFSPLPTLLYFLIFTFLFIYLLSPFFMSFPLFRYIPFIIFHKKDFIIPYLEHKDVLCFYGLQFLFFHHYCQIKLLILI